MLKPLRVVLVAALLLAAGCTTTDSGDAVTIGGGFGKITKLAQGAMDLHSGRSQVDFEWLAKFAPVYLHKDVKAANTAQQVLEMLGAGLARDVAGEAKLKVEKIFKLCVRR